MVGRGFQTKQIDEILSLKRSSFVAVTGRRRVGKTFMVEKLFRKHYCFNVTGIQNGDMKTQMVNFVQKLSEYSNKQIVTLPNNWQEAFILLKQHLMTLSKRKKQVLFFDELPWISTHKSGFIQLFAHLWNDYLSKENHFILVICGSATSWITKNIVNDRGGFHNRVTHYIHLLPFTILETKEFLLSKQIKWTHNSICEIYMAMGGVPFYLEQIKKGESPMTAIDRICFGSRGTLVNEYQNLYKSLFDQPENHEAIVEVLASATHGLKRSELLKLSKVKDGGTSTRTLNDLIDCGFVAATPPYGKIKRDMIYRLTDEFSIFYHRFMKGNKKNSWKQIAESQKYKIWRGFAFENFVIKHLSQLKKALGIHGVFSREYSFYQKGDKNFAGIQLDLVVERSDKVIHLCEMKYYTASYKIDKSYAQTLNHRKEQFRNIVNQNKIIYTTLIVNQDMMINEYSIEAVDVAVTLDEIFEAN